MQYFTIFYHSFEDAEPETRANLAECFGGFITEIDKGHNGERYFGIVVNAMRTPAQQLHTIGHELAHLDRLHLDRLNEQEREKLEHEAEELADQYAQRYTSGDFDKWKVNRQSAKPSLQNIAE